MGLLLKENEKMEPSKTPSNEDLDIQIHALKARMTMLERDVDFNREMARIEHDRCIRWAVIQDRYIDRLWLMYFILACTITLHGLGHILTNWGK